MTLRLIEGPTTLPVTVAEAKQNSRVELSDDDALIEDLIRAALQHAEMWCGQAFALQTWEQVYDSFPDGSTTEVSLGIGPVVSIVSISYDDELGDEQTVDPASFQLDNVSREGWIAPVAGFEWPSTLDAINSVRIRFTVGGPATADVKRAILLLVDHWYTNRGATSDENVRSIPLGVESLLNLHRRMFV